MKKKFIGPSSPGPDGEDLGTDVTVAGRRLGTVRSGEVFEVPKAVWDDIVASHKAADCPLPVWPEALWEDVAERQPAKTSTKGES